MSYDNTNTFVLFINDKQGNDKRPDRTGTLNVDGVEYFMDGWLRDGKDGAKFLSGVIKPKKGGKTRRETGQGDVDIPF